MAKRKMKLWSVTRITDPRFPGITLRVTEMTPGGTLYVVRQVEGKQRMTSLKVTRSDLGKGQKEQESAARGRALDLIPEIANGKALGRQGARKVPPAGDGALTLGGLGDFYEERGSLAGQPAYRKEQVTKVRRLTAFLGAETPVSDLKASDLQRYYLHRTAEGRARAAARSDLQALAIACNFAVNEDLLDASPFARIKLATITGKATPRRPWTTPERYEKLRAVADQLPPAFGVLLDVGWATGHRISAILGLTWEDVDFRTQDLAPHGAIRWYAGRATTNKATEHVVPMNSLARAALERWRAARPGIGSALVFPLGKDPARPVDRHSIKTWLTKAEQLAGLDHEPGGGWHMLRRGWATLRKDLPLKDVAAAGGWRDTATVTRCYQHADAATTLKVVTRGG